MKDLREIKSEIRKIVNDTIEAGAIGNVQFFTAKVMAKHDGIQGSDADFYLICAHEVVVAEVKKAVGKYETPDAETPLMAGFEHMRTAYPVHRDGDHLLVPVQLCTDEELEARAADFEYAARGYIKHAQEIRGYIRQRRDMAAGQGQLG